MMTARTVGVTVAIIVMTFGNVDAQGRRGVQQRPQQRQQQVGIGAVAWSDNGCLYVMTEAGWALGEWCRQFPTGDPRLYDVWRSQDRRRTLVSQFNISEPGWITEHVYATQQTFKYRPNNPANKLLAYNGQWISEAQQLSELQRLLRELRIALAQQAQTSQGQAQQTRAQVQSVEERIAATRATTGTCPVGMPMYGPLTADQQICNQLMGQLITTTALPNCTSASGHPYNANGTIADGWYDTNTGPRRKNCR